LTVFPCKLMESLSRTMRGLMLLFMLPNDVTPVQQTEREIVEFDIPLNIVMIMIEIVRCNSKGSSNRIICMH